jgi:Kinesin motor domain
MCWQSVVYLCLSTDTPLTHAPHHHRQQNSAHNVMNDHNYERSEDEYDVSFVYGPDATSADVHARSVAPLLHKLVEGYNVAVLMLGATGACGTPCSHFCICCRSIIHA